MIPSDSMGDAAWARPNGNGRHRPPDVPSERLMRVLDSHADAVVILDGALRVQWLNRAARRFVREPAGGVRGVRVHEILLPAIAAGVLRECGRAVCEAEPAICEVTVDDDEVRWVRVHALSLGEGAVVHIRDVTERRELKQQLRQAQKMGALGRLTSGIVHDFNNMLMAIETSTEFALQSADSPHEVRSELERVRQGTQRAIALTRRLLAFIGSRGYEPQVLDMNALITETTGILRRLLGEPIELQLELAPGELYVRADPGHLEQVIVNLVLNARDAMPDGGRLTLATEIVQVTHGLAERLRGRIGRGEAVRLRVCDTGTGMDAETLSRAFDPFFTTKEPGQGTGLGLPTVREVVQESGGALRAESRVGEGTKVEVYMPRSETNGRPAPKRRTEPDPAGGGETVLVAEDDEAVRRLLVRLLRQHEYRVLEAADGREAVDIGTRHDTRIDLIIADVVMPKLGGLEVVRTLTERDPEIPAIFLSGYAAEPDAESLGRERVTMTLKKPVSPSVLLQAVRELLDDGVA